ncbi:MAG TPA: bifunctional aspartate kinase/homoserine dehydrogenase I [Gemmatimonadaceae bacterium]|nr:bifunctional aspartate kinase/homoserine dehydrogenase I [Gemmatimonadaceae bacterium]
MPTPRRPSRSPRPVVHKFGGASLANGAAMSHATRVIASQPRGPRVVVVSAMAGVTDALIAAAESAAAGDLVKVREITHRLQTAHLAAARSLRVPASARKSLESLVRETFRGLREIAVGIAAVREVTPRMLALIVSSGERLSAQLMSAALRGASLRCEMVDASEIIFTHDSAPNATPNLRATSLAARRRLQPLLARGIIPIVPGYFGTSPAGDVVTLGRGGSDLTATLLARALSAPDVLLWKDVSGLMTADPRTVPNARVLPHVTPREAAELAYYGAKVLHPRALIPLQDRATRIGIRPFADPSVSGTVISPRRATAAYPVTAVSAIPALALVTVEGNGMLGVPGIAARTFATLHREGVSVSLISQASSEHSICLTVPDESADTARQALRSAFADDVAQGNIDGIQVRRDVGALALVGRGMSGTPGIAARAFEALASADINVVAIAQGASELNISIVVERRNLEAAIRRVHAAFQLDRIGGGTVARDARCDVVLLGFGVVARALADLWPRRARGGVRVRIVAAIDRSGYIFDAEGLTRNRLVRLAREKDAGAALAKLPGGKAAAPRAAVAAIASHALSHPVLVDLTADDTAPVLREGISSGMELVLANKRPLAGPVEEMRELMDTAREHGRRIRHETTVGAGLPVIDTFHKLVEAGDRIARIEGATSGTLGFLMTELERGRPFSEALARAMSLGYTEPDPRDDLSGMDVGRKALILGRLMGFSGELRDVDVESLLPEWTRALSRDAFLRRVSELDPDWQARVERAKSRGRVLRYLSTVTARRVHVGLREVEEGSAFATLRGTDNQLVFTTARYRSNPLVIKGPGAGPSVTAAGVLNDILHLAGAR